MYRKYVFTLLQHQEVTARGEAVERELIYIYVLCVVYLYL